MNDVQDQLLGDRLNTEAVIFRGYTDSELSLTIQLCAVLYAPTGLAGGFLAGNVGMGLGAATLASVATVWFGANLFQRWKRGRPDFHLQQHAHILLGDRGLTRCEFLRGEGARFRFPDGSYQMSLGRDCPDEY
jgi:conjugative transfer region protein (TIGR03750 family)